jgi:hypothetical protein
MISKELKKEIQENKKKLETHEYFSSKLKNLVYKNKTISKEDLNILLKMIKFDHNSLKESSFSPEINLPNKLEKIVFLGKSQKFAELIGITLGDGNLSGGNYRITLHSNEINYRKYIIKLFSNIFGIQLKIHFRKDANAIQLFKTNKEITKILLNAGIKQGNKVKNNVGIPDWISKNKKYMESCLRGLVDTDGYLHIHKRDKQMYVGFKNHSVQLLDDFERLSLKLGYNFTRGEKHLILYKKNQVKKFVETIGLSNQKHIDKYEKFYGAARI